MLPSGFSGGSLKFDSTQSWIMPASSRGRPSTVAMTSAGIGTAQAPTRSVARAARRSTNPSVTSWTTLLISGTRCSTSAGRSASRYNRRSAACRGRSVELRFLRRAADRPLRRDEDGVRCCRTRGGSVPLRRRHRSGSPRRRRHRRFAPWRPGRGPGARSDQPTDRAAPHCRSGRIRSGTWARRRANP